MRRPWWEPLIILVGLFWTLSSSILTGHAQERVTPTHLGEPCHSTGHCTLMRGSAPFHSIAPPASLPGKWAQQTKIPNNYRFWKDREELSNVIITHQWEPQRHALQLASLIPCITHTESRADNMGLRVDSWNLWKDACEWVKINLSSCVNNPSIRSCTEFWCSAGSPCPSNSFPHLLPHRPPSCQSLCK